MRLASWKLNLHKRAYNNQALLTVVKLSAFMSRPQVGKDAGVLPVRDQPEPVPLAARLHQAEPHPEGAPHSTCAVSHPAIMCLLCVFRIWLP